MVTEIENLHFLRIVQAAWDQYLAGASATSAASAASVDCVPARRPLSHQQYRLSILLDLIDFTALWNAVLCSSKKESVITDGAAEITAH